MPGGSITVLEFKALFRLRDVLQSANSFDQILDAACDVLAEVLDVSRVSVQIFSPSGETRFQASRGLSESYRRLIEERWRVTFDPQAPRTFISPRLEGDEREPLWREIVGEGIRALISVPLVAQEKLLGKVVAYRDQPHDFSRHEIELMEVIANIVAIAVSRQQSDEARDQALAELRRAQEELKTYHDLMTHDVTNFAATLSGLMERLLAGTGGTLTTEQETLLRRAARQVYQLTRLADNAKQLSRIRERGLAPSGSPLDLCDIVNRMARIVRAAQFDRPLRVEIRCPPGLRIPGVPFIESVFLNLFDNAVRHTPGQGGVQVEVEAAGMEARTRIAVRGGPPPDEEMLAHLFERYQPGARSTGSGLGLALIREIVERAGGEVRVGRADAFGMKVFEVTLTLPSVEG
jgi:signal transduction histidine kinase